MTVTADDLRHAYSWDDLAAVIDLARAPALPMPLAAPPPPPPAPVAPRPKSPRPRLVPVTPMRQATAKSMTKLADSMKESHPEMTVHQHVRDAARMLRTGNEEAAQRHLRAAMYSLSPQSIYRHGITTDDGHIQARQALHGVHRHLLLVKDIVDVGEKNRAAIARHAAEDDTGSAAPPASPVHADPNAGYGPGALAQKPTQRQPGGDRALNAPARTNSGGSDPNVADPLGPQPKGSKQFATWDEVGRVIGLAAPQQAPGWGWDELAAVIDLSADQSGPLRAVKPGFSPVIPGGRAGGPAAGRSNPSWDDLAAVIGLSAETPRLAVTPAPYGKPGGPGLYGVKGLKHSDYLEQIVHALMTKRGMDKGRATAIARGAIRKWMRGDGKVHPEVRAAAGLAEAEELKAQARAHAHSVTWDDLSAVIELAAAQPRVPAGSPAGGQFAAGSTGAAPTNAAPVGSGAKGTQVSDLQKRLNALGMKPPLKVDGLFGPATLAAVKAFQKSHGLKATGWSARTRRARCGPRPPRPRPRPSTRPQPRPRLRPARRP